MERQQQFQGLVMDIGVSEGNDTAYYLAKGFRVVAVEADQNACHLLRSRFGSEIESGALVLLNFAASDSFGEYVEFFVHAPHQPVSSMSRREGRGIDPGGYSAHLVSTIDWRTLLAQAGMPRYLKIDIEGHEEQFLTGMFGHAELPEFVSVEAYELRPCEMLLEMGYERFKLVDQNPPGGFRLPLRQMEGLRLQSADFTHASGLFGLDLFGDGDWLDFNAFQQAWLACQPQVSRTWFDCHGWRPN
jgi:FkbM family methyltransferase